MQAPIISIQNIHKSYSTGKSVSLDVLRGVTFEVQRGEILAIVGSSGAGKSTLLHIMGALDRPSSGSVSMDGEDVFALDDQRLASFRNRNMGFIFQFHHLLPEFTAWENVAIPAMISGMSVSKAEKISRKLLASVRVDHRADARPSELSGGEQQRVAVARALINEPVIVLADEPSGNLDEENALLLQSLLWDLARERKQTFVIVTHDASLAGKADAVFTLHDGNLVDEKRRTMHGE